MPECYFHVTNCAYTGTFCAPIADTELERSIECAPFVAADNEGKSEGCVDVLKMRAIEGSSDYSAEQVAVAPAYLFSIPCVDRCRT